MLTVREVRLRHEQELMALPGVTGVAVATRDGQDVIQVLVTRRAEGRDLPAELDGFPVDIVEVGGLRAHE